jgi:Bax protein
MGVEVGRMRFCVLLLFSLMLFMVGFAYGQNPSSGQDKFIQSVLQQSRNVNKKVYKQRKQLLIYYQHFKDGVFIFSWDKYWLQKLAEQYKLGKPHFSQAETWRVLLARVDIIPNSLIIAQAVNESNWGRSRFAVYGNNYFGQQCYTPGCGIVPKKRPASSKMEVRKFKDLYDSVKNYVLNLDTNARYRDFRKLRADLRKENRKLDSLKLTPGLKGYAERTNYAQSIQNIIKKYRLQQYDANAS